MGTKADGDVTVNPAIQEQQFELLGDIQVITFAANPATIRPFGTTTVTWHVKLPTALKAPVKLTIGNKPVQGLSGSITFSFDVTTQINMVAATALVDRSIKSLTVMVDTAECRTNNSIPGFGITGQIKQALDAGFTGRLRGNGTTVTLGFGTISAKTPITLGGSRTMDIDIELAVGMSQHAPTVRSTSVGVSINLDTAADVESWCSNASAQIAQPFMQHIVDNELVPGVLKAFNDNVNGVITAAEKADRMHRHFELTAFTLNGDGVQFTVCPTTPGITTTGQGQSIFD